GYAASPEEMATKGDALRRFSRAIVKASLLVRYNPKAAARALQTADGMPLDEATLKAKTAELIAWQDDLPASDPNSKQIGLVSLKGMEAYIKLLAEAGAIKTAVPVSSVVTEDYIAYANTFDRKAFKKAALAAR
ncbi:MAG TPA: hypothetical protein VG960_12995, partial [Caulobacteraceae bacterium]|nr:hypothetical protein [Caulobacteraceae bacterium]